MNTLTRKFLAIALLLLAALLCAYQFQSKPVASQFRLLPNGSVITRGGALRSLLYSPHVPASECRGFEASSSIFDDVTSKYTSFYPPATQVFHESNQHSQICNVPENGAVRLLVAVLSKPDNFRKRSAIRDTYASREACLDNMVAMHQVSCDLVHNSTRIVFFAGVSDTEPSVNQRLREESQIYGDVVQLAKLERYEDLSSKTLSVFHWVSDYCPRIQFLAKVDDDSIVNLANLLRSLDAFDDWQYHFIAGQVQNTPKIIRSASSPYYTPRSVLPGSASSLPYYAFGGGYFMPMRTAKLLYQAGRCVATISIEDLFITGLLRNSLNVALVSQPCIYCYQLSIQTAVQDFHKLLILHHVEPDAMRSIWKRLTLQFDASTQDAAAIERRRNLAATSGSCSWWSVLEWFRIKFES